MNLDLPWSATVMDPWNGTGTTTDVAEQMGYFAIGLDINPVMVLIAKGRRVWRNYSKLDILTLTKQIVDCVLEESEKWCEIQHDPLSRSFIHLVSG
ncbi:tRNA G10 N-methylase Trm11 [Caldalkalibacillus uzonensis]|uniref:tRNA G10 N-methylase Trm11 n=1 Tax=Caldalkalibacillus uzonensis TaxID=353224 RepID=A0ABU0CW60_9BACI|nr:DNA methyltransferase [Caldalkalibacillus uzonensis]MDQ0340574.1 tRNA G10 N-methylase Trm11 [Caldalkalibacillus uzonensis]